MGITLNYLIANMLIVFSAFYLQTTPLSPVYVCFLFSLFIYITRKLLIKDSKINFIFYRLILFLFFLIILYHYVLGLLNYTLLQKIFWLIVPVSYLPLVYNTLIPLKDIIIFRIIRRFLNFNLILLTIESIFRITNSNFNNLYLYGDFNFYIFKYESIMLGDSNYVAIIILTLYFFCFYLEKQFNKDFKLYKLILFILNFLTFSRAAIITMLLFMLLYNLKNNTLLKKSIILLTVFLFSYFAIIKFSGDGSLSTKFEIVELFRVYIKKAGLNNILFGFGDKAKLFFGKNKIIGHNLIGLTYDYGFVGVLTFVLLWGYIIYRTNSKSLIIMFPLLFSGMSLFLLDTPYIYVIFSIMMVFETKKKINFVGE